MGSMAQHGDTATAETETETDEQQVAKLEQSLVPGALVVTKRIAPTAKGTEEFNVEWVVPEGTLASRDKSAVSPPFELSISGRRVKFKLLLFPKESSQSRGGSSFNKRAKGRGLLELKCEDELHSACPLSFEFYVGSEPRRGPVAHDFSLSAVKGLPKEIETWHLDKSVVALPNRPSGSGAFV